MKAGFFSLTAVSLLQLSQAQPAHIGGIAHKHPARDVVTQTAYVTASTPDAMVIVDQHGNPISTSYMNAPAETAAPQPATSAQAPAAAPSAAKSVSAEAVSAPAAQASYSAAPASAAPSAHASASASDSGASAGSSSGAPAGGSSTGINYSPYHGDHTCKSADEVMKDFKGFTGYGIVRSYGTDCDQVSSMVSAAKAHNMKIMLGVYNPQDAQNEAQKIVSGIKSANGGDWSIVHSVSVGNEAVNSGQASPDQVISGLKTAKGVLTGAGYNGKVVTVDTFDALIKNPQLCQASDYAAANIHAFFNAQTEAKDAGKYVQQQVQNVKQACGGKDVIVTESGWPTQGSANGAAVPSKENQQAAVKSLQNAFSNGGLFLFSAYNDLWKTDFSGSFGCEKYWGMLGDSSN